MTYGAPPPASGWSEEDLAGYAAVGSGPAAYRRRRDVLRLHGPETLSYLQGQCSQDVERLAPGDSAEALLLAPDGKLDALIRVTRLDEEACLVDTEGGFADRVAGRLQRFRLRTKVAIEPLDWACLARRGDRVELEPHPAGGHAGPASGAPQRRPVAVTAGLAVGRHGVDLLGPAEALVVPAGVVWISDRAWEARRIEAGVAVMGRELDGRTIPAEGGPGLLAAAVSLTKGCYTGQELVARLDARGNRVARQLRGLVVDDTPTAARGGVDGLVGAELHAADERGSQTGADDPATSRSRGAVTSATWSPEHQRVLALAFVHRSISPGEEVRLGAPDSRVRARVHELPFPSPLG